MVITTLKHSKNLTPYLTSLNILNTPHRAGCISVSPICFFCELSSRAAARAEHVLHVEDVGHLLGA